MNRLFYLIIVVLLAISCESDNCPAPDQEANEIECTFMVGIPEIKTRAAADPSGSGVNAKTLYYRFYDENDQPLSIAGASHTGKPDDNGDMTWTISKNSSLKSMSRYLHPISGTTRNAAQKFWPS